MFFKITLQINSLSLHFHFILSLIPAPRAYLYTMPKKKMSAKAKILKRQKQNQKPKYGAPKAAKKAPKRKHPKREEPEQKERVQEPETEQEQEDYSQFLEPIHAHDLKHGMWCIDDNSGYPGQVKQLNKSKTGKHGHTKFTYKLVMPHSGKSSNPMHPGKDQLQRPVVQKEECVFIRFMDEQQTKVQVEDRKGTKRVIAISPQPKVNEKVMGVMDRRRKDEVMVMTVLKAPRYSPKKVVLVECVIDVKSMKGKA